MRLTLLPVLLFISSLSVTLAAPVEYKSFKAGDDFRISEIKRDIAPEEHILSKRDIPALTLLFKSLNNSATISLGVTALQLTADRDQATNFVASFIQTRGLTSTFQAGDQSGLVLSIVLMVLTHYETIDGAIKVINYYTSGASCNPASPGIIGSAINGVTGAVDGVTSIVGGILGQGSGSSTSTSAYVCNPAANVTISSHGIIGDIAGGIAGGVSGVSNGAANGVSGVANGAANGVSGVANGAASGVSGVANGVATGISDISGGNAIVSGVAGGVANGVSGVANGVASGVSGTANGVASGVSGVAHGVSGVVSGIAGGIAGLFKVRSVISKVPASPELLQVSSSTRVTASAPTVATIATASTPVVLSTSTNTIVPDTNSEITTSRISVPTLKTAATGQPGLTGNVVDGIGSIIGGILRREDLAKLADEEGLIAVMRRDDVDEVDLMHQLMKRALADIEDNSSDALGKRDIVMSLIYSQIIGIIGTNGNIEQIFESLQRSGLAINVVYNALVNSGFYQFDVQLVTYLFKTGRVSLSSLLSSALSSGLLIHLVTKILTTSAYLKLVLNFVLASFTSGVRTFALIKALLTII